MHLTLLAFTLALGVASAFRHELQHEAALRTESKSEAERAGGCKGMTTCGKCLVSTPFLWGGEYCKWCPEDYWYGPASAHPGEAKGVCRASSFSDDICGGGTKWIYAKQMTAGEDKDTYSFPGKVAVETEANYICPDPNAALSDDMHPRRWMLRDLTSKDLEDAATLETTLARLNLAIQRLNRLRTTNPTLFNHHFSTGMAQKVAFYSWKAAVYGVTWIPAVGGAISLGLGVVTAATEATTKEVETQLQSQRESQRLLCWKGKDASLPYFSDVTFGMLLEQYSKVREVTEEAVRMKQNRTLDSAMVGAAGDSAIKANEVLSSNAAKAAKALLHTGLFIGGFFSFGITWLVGGGLGAAELMAEWSATYAAATSLSMKMFLLTALARQLDESTWASDTTVCYITDVDRDEDPCPDVMRPDGSGKVNRVCSRSSPWNHHLTHIPNAEMSPEGRCLPRANVALGNGLPCLTHEACSSGYCHFEPMLQYFFSDHKRAPCPKKIGGTQSCTNVFDQLLALQVSSVQAQMNYTRKEDELLWNVYPENFTDTYTGSFQGPVYATTGTCATACPKEQVGKGTCAGISIGGTELDVRIPFLGRFEFGVRQSNRIFSGHLSFERVGNGICGALADNIEGDDDQINEPYAARERVVIATANSLDELLQACADYCKADAAFACESFSARILPEEDGMVCDLYDQVADTAHDTGDSSCYTLTESWPLDVYQPWNIEWSFYLMNLRGVMKALLSTSKAEQSLKAVRKAYPGYCKENVFSKTQQHCLPPKDWTDWDAVNVLRFGAPLSFHQLQDVHEEIFPGSTEKIAVGGDKIKVLDLLNRPHGFGMAWRSYLHESAISKARDVEYTKAPSMRDKLWVQRVEVRAFQYKLRTHDGLWDLGAASRHLASEEAQSVQPQEIQKMEMQKMIKKRKHRSQQSSDDKPRQNV